MFLRCALHLVQLGIPFDSFDALDTKLVISLLDLSNSCLLASPGQGRRGWSRSSHMAGLGNALAVVSSAGLSLSRHTGAGIGIRPQKSVFLQHCLQLGIALRFVHTTSAPPTDGHIGDTLLACSSRKGGSDIVSVSAEEGETNSSDLGAAHGDRRGGHMALFDEDE